MSRSARSLASSSFFNKALADPQTILALMSKIESWVRTYNLKKKQLQILGHSKYLSIFNLTFKIVYFTQINIENHE